MPNLITAGGASDPLALSAASDGALTLQTGPSGAKVNALALDATGNGALLGTLTQAGIATPRIQLMTAQNTTSGTSIDFTSIPSWVKKITVMLNGVSTNGTSALALRIGPSITPETIGYSATGSFISTVTAGASASSTHWLIGNSLVAARSVSGQAVLTLMNASTNLWTYSGSCAEDTFSNMYLGTGSKAVTGSLGVLRLTTVNGTDTFDLGSVNLLLEG